MTGYGTRDTRERDKKVEKKNSAGGTAKGTSYLSKP